MRQTTLKKGFDRNKNSVWEGYCGQLQFGSDEVPRFRQSHSVSNKGNKGKPRWGSRVPQKVGKEGDFDKTWRESTGGRWMGAGLSKIGLPESLANCEKMLTKEVRMTRPGMPHLLNDPVEVINSRITARILPQHANSKLNCN